MLTNRKFNADDYEQVDAFNRNGTQKVFYLFNPVRPEQMLGFTQFAAGLKDMQDLDRIIDAEKLAMLEDACLTGFVKTMNPTGFQGAYTDPGKKEDRIHEFSPNKWHYLNPDEEVDIHSPKRPNEQLQNMIDQLLRGPANALDVPPEVLSQNWRDFNYSNARTVLLFFYLSCRVRQKYLVDHFLTPVYESVAVQMVAKGLVQAPAFDRRREDYMNHAWIPPGWQWIDPVKEAEGKQIETDNNFDSIYNVCASKGNDAEEILESNARFLKRKKDLEEKHGIKFPDNSKNPAQKPGDIDEPTEPDAKRTLEVVKNA